MMDIASAAGCVYIPEYDSLLCNGRVVHIEIEGNRYSIIDFTTGIETEVTNFHDLILRLRGFAFLPPMPNRLKKRVNDVIQIGMAGYVPPTTPAQPQLTPTQPQITGGGGSPFTPAPTQPTVTPTSTPAQSTPTATSQATQQANQPATVRVTNQSVNKPNKNIKVTNLPRREVVSQDTALIIKQIQNSTEQITKELQNMADKIANRNTIDTRDIVVQLRNIFNILSNELGKIDVTLTLINNKLSTIRNVAVDNRDKEETGVQ